MRAAHVLVVLGVILLVLVSGDALAANNAYAVDAADISDLNTCKLESWLSAAKNGDLYAVANPSCVVEIGRPVELSLLTSRYRSDGEWGTFVQPKVKFNIEPTGVGKLGYSFLAATAFDAQTGQQLNTTVEVPATYRFSETTRININAGWYWDRVIDQHYFTYGAGFDWLFAPKFSFTIEAFGLVGNRVLDQPSAIRPRIQTGFRYRPNEIFSVDVIYGHNITGENSHWITVGTTVRFSPEQ